jgi:stearoyl-CoA desaturase (delta-9 desaturase)
MMLLAGVLRMVMTHHTTFFINSLAHIWGSQPFTDRNSARDNGILAFFTFGEGYHNFHHLFENDYRNGIQWWQFDLTKWLIRTAAWCGLAKDLRSCPEERIEQARLRCSSSAPRPECTSRMTGNAGRHCCRRSTTS